MKKLLAVALVAVMSVFAVSCGKDKDLSGTTWINSTTETMTEQGMTATITADAKLIFIDTEKGKTETHVVMTIDGMGELMNDTQTMNFTYTFDGEKGTITNEATPTMPATTGEFTLVDDDHIKVVDTDPETGKAYEVVFTKQK